MEPLAVHHIGVAVPSIDDALHFYGDKLGLSVAESIELADRQLKVTFVQAGNVLIELMEPTDPDTPVARFLERRGPGLHHLCFGTPDIRKHLRDLRDKGVELIDEEPRPGAHGDVAFLQPASALGVLVELVQAGRAPAADLSEVSEPAQPAQSSEAAEPAKPSESALPVERSEPSEPLEPLEASEP